MYYPNHSKIHSKYALTNLRVILTKSYLMNKYNKKKYNGYFSSISPFFYRIATYLLQIFAGAYCHTRRRYVPERGTAMPGRIVDLRLHHPYNKQRPYMNRLRHISITLLMLMAAFPLSAQEKADNVFTFRFLPGKDMFFAPAMNNGEELAWLLDCVERYREMIIKYEIPLQVDGYCISKDNKAENLAIAKTRSNRVKSELITRKGLTEKCFITRNHAEQGDFVTVRIVVPKAEIPVADNDTDGEATEPVPADKPVENVSKWETACETRKTSAGNVSDAENAPEAASDSHFSLRANLLRWATLTPDLGVEWRISRHVGIAVNGTYTSWSWDDKNRRYALWEVAPELRYYIGKKKRGYIGAMYKVGEFNYKFSETGKQGDLMGGGITGGYQLKLNKALSMDFSLGLGYLRADYEKYSVIDGTRVRRGKESKNRWGPTSAGVTLVWTIF